MAQTDTSDQIRFAKYHYTSPGIAEVKSGGLLYEDVRDGFSRAETLALLWLLNNGFDHLGFEALEPIMVKCAPLIAARRKSRREAMQGTSHQHNEALVMRIVYDGALDAIRSTAATLIDRED